MSEEPLYFTNGIRLPPTVALDPPTLTDGPIRDSKMSDLPCQQALQLDKSLLLGKIGENRGFF